MASKRLVVSIDASRDDSFGLVSPDFLQRVIVPHFAELPPVVALELTTTCDAENKATPGKIFIGCVTSMPLATQNKLLVSPLFASDLQLRDGDLLSANVLVGTPAADKVLVSPASVDDSEVVEHNAIQIESTLLRKLRVVTVGMKVTVVVHRGLHAQLVIDRVDLAGDGLHGKCAMLCEGTELHVATRSRAVPSSAQEQPAEAFLRCLPYIGTSGAYATGDLLVSKELARRSAWREAMDVGVLNMASLAWEESLKLPPSTLRSGAAKARVRIVESGSLGSVSLVGFDASATTIFVFPDPPPAVSKDVGALVTAQMALTSSPLNVGSYIVPTAALTEVHGDVVQRLSRYLGVIITASPEHFFFSHNILLVGGKGSGKSTIALSVAQGVPGAHVEYFDCASSGKDKSTLATLQRLFLEASLCAPAIIVLDNLDTMAPAQQEGNNASMSSTTEASIEAMLTTLSGYKSTQVSRGPVVVLATSTALEALHEKVRGSSCFASVEPIQALVIASRTALLRQQLSSRLGPGVVLDDAVAKAAAKLTDNYSPFDIVQVSKRLASSIDGAGTISKKQLAAIVGGFTPLAHSGTQFLSSSEKKSWCDIGGMRDAKKALHDALVLPLKHPKLFAKLPLKTRSGVLLFGPPGCGKSYIVSSVVAAEGLHCILVNGPEIFGKYIGQSEQKVREIFEKAQAAAPSVIFFDEFESVAPQRGHDNTGVTDRVVNQLLCYLDGVEARKNVFVVAASSRPDLIDAALLRPGRLDKAVLCPMPDEADRREVLEVHLRAVGSVLPAPDLDELVGLTEHWTCADLAGLVASANMLVVQENIDMTKELAALNLRGDGGTDTSVSLDASASVVFARGSLPRGVMEKTREALASARESALRGSGRSGAVATSAAPRRVLTMNHMRHALTTTRRSTTDLDLAKQKALCERFLKAREPGGASVVPQPGSKVTFA